MTHFLWGITVGVWLTIGAHIIMFEDKVKEYDKAINIVNQANDAIEECERSLPRDQYCTITAVPKTSHETSR